MAEFDQSTNPYAPPSETVPVAGIADEDALDEIQETLTRAFYAATYGTVFLPGFAYCVALFLLAKIYLRRAEFAPEHHRQITITAIICLLLSPLMLGGVLAAVLGVLSL